MTANKITIFVVEDNEMTRVAIKGALSKVGEFQVVGVAGDGQSAVEGVLNLRPDVVLVDIGLPVLDGIEATKRLKQSDLKPRILMLTAHDSDRDIFASFEAGADGYLIKDGFAPRLESAVKSVHDGVAWLDPRIAAQVLEAVTSWAPRLKTVPVPMPMPLQMPGLVKETEAKAVSTQNPKAATAVQIEPLSAHEEDVLKKVAAHEPMCKDGVCLIDPDFMLKLHRFKNIT